MLKLPNQFCIVGPLPPPMTGLSSINTAMARELGMEGIVVIRLSTSPPDLRRGLVPRLSRLPLVGKALVQLGRGILNHRISHVYIGVSGGWGQVYDVLFMLVARAAGKHAILHHHSFAYLDAQSFLTKSLFWVAGIHATHIFLSAKMANLAEARYALNRNQLTVLSNTFFLRDKDFGDASPVAIKGRCRTLGFIGNISREKGVLLFLDLLARLQEQGLAINAILAGPFQDVEIERLVLDRIVKIENLSYIGAVTGQTKNAFFENIDVLIFPTLYRNEAEPLSIIEAMSYGAAVISFDRGCISEMLAREAGVVIAQREDFVDEACTRIRSWVKDDHEFARQSHRSRTSFIESAERAKINWNCFIDIVRKQTEINAVEI